MSRRSTTYTKPRANPPVCWLCDKRLWAGGRSYVVVVEKSDDLRRTRPAHVTCAEKHADSVEVVA